jgi:hypothetical protein
MKLLNVIDIKALETSSTIDAETAPAYDKNATYTQMQTVQFGDIVYISVKDGNTGNQPDTHNSLWFPDRPINPKSLYDVYPTTLAQNNSSDIVVTYNITTPIDMVYVGNAIGSSLKIEFAGETFYQAIDTTNSPYNAWGVTNKNYGSINGFIMLNAPTKGKLKITVKKGTDKTALGYVSAGILEHLGCTLMNEAIKYNVVTGVKIKGTVASAKRAKSDSWTEISIPVLVRDNKELPRIINTLGKYRGIPVLVVPDDIGERKELIFFGVYTELEASITQQNKYNLNLNSLDLNSFTPATDLETAQDEKDKEDGLLNVNHLYDVIFWGFDSGVNGNIIFDNSDIDGYYDGYAIKFQANVDAIDNGKINVNALGDKPIYKDGIPIKAGEYKAGRTLLMYYQNNRFNLVDENPPPPAEKFIKDIVWAGQMGGSANSPTLTTYSDLKKLENGTVVHIRPTSTNTGTVKLNVNGLGAKNILTVSGANLKSGELQANKDYTLVYVGGTWRLDKDAIPKASFFLGVSSSNPTRRTDGTSLHNGDHYFNTCTHTQLTYYSGLWYLDGQDNAGTFAGCQSTEPTKRTNGTTLRRGDMWYDTGNRKWVEYDGTKWGADAPSSGGNGDGACCTFVTVLDVQDIYFPSKVSLSVHQTKKLWQDNRSRPRYYGNVKIEVRNSGRYILIDDNDKTLISFVLPAKGSKIIDPHKYPFTRVGYEWE